MHIANRRREPVHGSAETHDDDEDDEPEGPAKTEEEKMFVSSALKKNEIFEGCAALLTRLPRRGTHAIRHARVWGVGSRA